ncbi:MAG: hypothetical protein R2749_02685 [Acidimicrobiales bacterium]
MRTTSDAEIRIAEAVPASPPGRRSATAAVDERDIYGLRLFGVPVRTAPRVDADQVATAHHGDVLEATCWAEGDELSTGFPEQPLADAYRSTLWFKVRIDGVEGSSPTPASAAARRRVGSTCRPARPRPSRRGRAPRRSHPGVVPRVRAWPKPKPMSLRPRRARRDRRAGSFRRCSRWWATPRWRWR